MATTSPLRFGNTRRCLGDRSCFTLATACRICRRPRRRTCSLRNLARVSRIDGIKCVANLADLVTYCENEKVPFVTFNDWTDILQTCKDIAAGKVTIKEAARGRV